MPFELTAQQIRAYLADSETGRRREEHLVRPFRALDLAISRLEGLHLRGVVELPPEMRAMLLDINRLLPSTIRHPRWRRRIAGSLDQCFDLQEALKRERDRL